MSGGIQLASGLNVSDQQMGVSFNRTDLTVEGTWSMRRTRRRASTEVMIMNMCVNSSLLSWPALRHSTVECDGLNIHREKVVTGI